MHTQDHTLETRRRVVRHMANSILAAVAGLASAGLAGLVASALDDGIVRSTLLVGALASMVALPVVLGVWSARRNLRCPGCNASFVRVQRSPRWTAHPSVHCPGCGALLFAARASRLRSGLAVMLVLVAMAMLSGAGAYFLNARPTPRQTR